MPIGTSRGRSDSSSNSINLIQMSPDLEAGTGLNDTDSLMCVACDPQSIIPHEMHISRFRIANLCCAGEGEYGADTPLFNWIL